MSGFSLKGLVVLFLIFFIVCSTLDVIEARRGKHGGGSVKPKQKPKPKPSPSSKPSPSPSPSPPSPHAAKFNVQAFGAKGDGITDDTKAFQLAWAAACNAEASTIVVPSDLKFLVGPISFSGRNCQPNMVFQLDGTIIAPTNPKPWGKGLLQWIEFTKLSGITIRGSGTIEGQGSAWWSSSKLNHSSVTFKLVGKMPSTRPTALRFYGSYNVTVSGITIQNSPKSHLKFDDCQVVDVSSITVSSPGSSPNTDGIHLQNSRYVAIHDSKLGCGDDCVSIQTGCSNIYIHDVDCGPGHGISIGGLGKDETVACVSNVTVQNVKLNNTLTGVRIKTWQGGSGSVRNVAFSNVTVSEVEMPIVIDQYYCDKKGGCRNQTAAVALSQLTYENIKGTYTVEPVRLACSDSSPCSGISLTDIELEPEEEEGRSVRAPFCWQAYGELHGPMIPPIDCLHDDDQRTSNELQRHQDACRQI